MEAASVVLCGGASVLYGVIEETHYESVSTAFSIWETRHCLVSTGGYYR